MADAEENRMVGPFDPNMNPGQEEPFFNNRLIGRLFYFTVALTTVFGLIGSFAGDFWLWVLAGLVVSITWFGLSIRTVKVSELGGIEFLNRPLREVSHGPHFVLWGLFQLPKLPGYNINDEFPGDPENVFKGPDDEYDHESGLLRPIRITAGVGNSRSSGPLESQMTAEIQLVLTWRIKPGSFFLFRERFETINNAREHLRDIMVTVVTEFGGKHTMGWIVKNTSKINAEIENRLREKFEPFGLEIISGSMKEPDLSRDVNLKLAAVPIAKAEAQQKVIAAAAERTRIEEEAAGTAKGERLRLKEKGQGIKEFAELANVCGAEVLGAEVAGEMFGKSDKVVLGGADGLKDVLAAAQVVKQAYSSNETPAKTSDEEEDKK